MRREHGWQRRYPRRVAAVVRPAGGRAVRSAVDGMCASCSQPLPDGARFCPFCGHEVALGTPSRSGAWSPCVFADLVGYTALSEHLDPERVKRLIDGSVRAADRRHQRLRRSRRQGPRRRHPRAVRCARRPRGRSPTGRSGPRSQMHASLARFVDEQPDLDKPLQLRIGVNTGEVVVGNVSGTTTTRRWVTWSTSRRGCRRWRRPAAILHRRLDRSAGLRRDPARAGRRRRGTRTRADRNGSGRSPVDDHSFRGSAPRSTTCRSSGARPSGSCCRRSWRWSPTGEARSCRSPARPGRGKTRLVTEALDRFPSRDVTIFSGRVRAVRRDQRLGTDRDGAVPATRARSGRAAERAPRGEPGEGRRALRVRGRRPVLDRFVEAVLHLLGYPSELDHVPPAQAREILVLADRRGPPPPIQHAGRSCCGSTTCSGPTCC